MFFLVFTAVKCFATGRGEGKDDVEGEGEIGGGV